MHDTSSNDLSLIVAQAIEEIKSEQGLEFSKEKRRSTLQNLNDEPESPGGSSDGSSPTASRTSRMG